jgi:DNA-binding XRE family transcriptional regulator
MLADPLVISLAGSSISMKRINQDAYSSEYLFRDATHQVRARIRHSQTNGVNGGPKMDRHNLELTETVFATTEAAQVDRKVYVVIEQEAKDTSVELANTLADSLIASSDALTKSLLSWES